MKDAAITTLGISVVMIAIGCAVTKKAKSEEGKLLGWVMMVYPPFGIPLALLAAYIASR